MFSTQTFSLVNYLRAVIVLFLILPQILQAQTPVISYQGSTYQFTTGASITPLTPVNTGGIISAGYYGQTSTLSTTQPIILPSQNLSSMGGAVVDSKGNTFICSTGENLIRKITPDGTVSVFAGSGTAGKDDGKGNLASFNHPLHLTVDGNDNIYVADRINGTLRKISPDAVVTTITKPGDISDLNQIKADSKGNVYCVSNNIIQKVTPAGVVSAFVSTGFTTIENLTLDEQGNIYAIDNRNIFKKITPDGLVTTLFTIQNTQYPFGMAVDRTGNIYVLLNGSIWRFDTKGKQTLVAGAIHNRDINTSYNVNYPSIDGIGADASFNGGCELYFNPDRNLIAVELGVFKIRKVFLNGYAVSPSLPAGLSFDASSGAINGKPIVTSPATDYAVSAFNANGSSTTTINLAVTADTQPPVVTSFSPASGTVGTVITLQGDHLGNSTYQSFGSIQPLLVSNNNQQLKGIIMHGAVSGAVSVTGANGSASAPGNLGILPSPDAFVQTGAKITLQGNTNAGFGKVLAISADGSTAAVGVKTYNNNTGAVWVYTRTVAGWTQGTQVTGDNVIGTAQFGSALAFSADGNTLAVGGSGDNGGLGAVWVFTRNNGNWQQQGSKLWGNNIYSYIVPAVGSSVSLSADGNTLMTGAETDGNVGSVWVFVRTNGQWRQQSHFGYTPPSPGAMMGHLVQLSGDGNTAVISTSNASTYNGLYVYGRKDSTWTFKQRLLPPDGTSPVFGSSIAISTDGKVIVAGCPTNSIAWVFTQPYGVWSDNNNIKADKISSPPGATGNTSFGSAVAVNADGSLLMIGGEQDNGFTGALWLYKLTGNAYAAKGTKIIPADNAGYANAGSSIAMATDGGTVITSGFADNKNAGALWTFSGLRLPYAVAQDASALTSSSATLNGQAFDNGSATSVSFEYSISADMTNVVNVPVSNGSSPIQAGTGSVTFTTTLNNLQSGQLYYYRIKAINAAGTNYSNVQQFTLVAGPPAISSFLPAAGAPGTVINITGTNLSSPVSVTVGNIPALVVSASSNQLSVFVMPGTNSGLIKITTKGGDASTAGNFTVFTTPYPVQGDKTPLFMQDPHSGTGSNAEVAMSADGNIAVVSFHCQLYFYKRNAADWVLQNTVTGLGDFIGNGAAHKLCLNANGTVLLALGEFAGEDIRVWAFYRKDDTWSTGQRIGSSIVIHSTLYKNIAISADGNTAVIEGNGSNVFYRSGDSTWIQQGAALLGSNANSVGEDTGAVTISSDGNTIARGQPTDNNYAGAAWVFKRTGQVWAQQGIKLTGNNGSLGQDFGSSLALSADGNTLMVGGDDRSLAKGASWFFTRTGDTWTQQGPPMVGTLDSALSQYSRQGHAVALSADGNIAVTSDPYYRDTYGAIWLFKRVNGVWTQLSKFYSNYSFPGGVLLGGSLALSADGSFLLGGTFGNSTRGLVDQFFAGPVVNTLPPLAAGSSTATLAGSALANGSDTQVAIEYGTTQSNTFTPATTVTGPNPLPADAASANYTASLNNLSPNTSYAYRITATNQYGTVRGKVINFSTDSKPFISAVDQSVVKAGSVINITGINLGDATKVALNDVPVSSFKINSATSITATIAPNSGAGRLALTVTNTNGITYYDTGIYFVPVPVITIDRGTYKDGDISWLTASPNLSNYGYTYSWMYNGKPATGNYYQQTITQEGSYAVTLTYKNVSEVSQPFDYRFKTVLPANYFKIAVTSATCKGSNNGSIAISADGSAVYSFVATLNGTNMSDPFSRQASFNNLAAGTYNVCITIPGKTDFQQCYTAVVIEPKDLSLFSAISNDGKNVTLNLSGGDMYSIQLNGVTTTTRDNTVTLALIPGKNNLIITTDKPCQGVIQRTINATTDYLVYPNPFNKSISLNIGYQATNKAVVEVYSSMGLLLVKQEFNKPSDTIEVDMSAIKMPGAYTLKLTTDNGPQIFKVLKQ